MRFYIISLPKDSLAFFVLIIYFENKYIELKNIHYFYDTDVTWMSTVQSRLTSWIRPPGKSNLIKARRIMYTKITHNVASAPSSYKTRTVDGETTHKTGKEEKRNSRCATLQQEGVFKASWRDLYEKKQ